MSVAAQKAAQDITYEDLYKRWEQSNWRATDLDFSQDAEGWRSLTEIQRKSALWTYSMFFYGEDSVTDNLSPYIDAAPKEEQKYFLATQQVDEARHTVFFNRFFKEVVGSGGDTVADNLAFTRQYHNWAYNKVFSRLDQMADELRADRSLPKFAQAITLYHLIVEAAMAQPGQHFIEDFFASEGTLPGFSEGMKNVSRDEQRHIGFGVKVLSELMPQSKEIEDAVVELLRDVMPFTIAVYVPPDWDLRYTREYGFELEDIYAFGLKSVKAKWRAIGYPLEEMPGVLPIDPTLDEREIAGRQIRLMRAGILGEPNGRPDSSPEIQGLYFDTVARSARTEQANGGVTIQWRFDDAEPWYLVIDNGSSRAEQGEAADADITLRSSWSDWIDVSIRGVDARRMMLRRRLRPRGSLRQLARLQKIFPPRQTPLV